MHQTRALCNPFGHGHVVGNANKAYLWKNPTNQQGRLWLNKKIGTKLSMLQFLQSIHLVLFLDFRHNFECRHMYTRSTQDRFNIFRDLSLMASGSLRFHHACAPWLRWMYKELGWLVTSGHENAAVQKPAPIEILKTLKLKVMGCLQYQLVQDLVHELWTAGLGRFKCILSTFPLIDLTKIRVSLETWD